MLNFISIKVILIISILAFFGPENVEEKTGYINVRNNKNLYYWYFESRSDPRNDPVILYLTSGAGCAASFSLFFNNGPFKLTDDVMLQKNPHSWNNHANVIFLDQPVGNGYSYTEKEGTTSVDEFDEEATHFINYRVASMEEAAEDVYLFIIKFLNKNEKIKYRDFFIFGEGYMGHYVSSIANYIIKKKRSDNETYIYLKGIGIGNGMFDPQLQFPKYLEFVEMYNEKYNLVSKAKYYLMRTSLPSCIGLIKTCKRGVFIPHSCTAALSLCGSYLVGGVKTLNNINHFDVTQKCENGPLCYDTSSIQTKLNDKDFMYLIGGNKDEYSICNAEVHENIIHDNKWMSSYKEDLKEILEDGKKVLLYYGEYDYVNNWVGGLEVANSLEWAGQAEFKAKSFNMITNNDGVDIGEGKNHSNLYYVTVKGAGLFSSHDQPQNMEYLVNNFIDELNL